MLVPLSVLTTIDFDNKKTFEADEIHNIWPNGMLTPELKAGEPTVSEVLPQMSLCISLVFAKPPSKVLHVPLPTLTLTLSPRGEGITGLTGLHHPRLLGEGFLSSPQGIEDY
jgi:hypothetical protein